MDFVKAKNISIMAFIILNIILGLLRYVESRRYVLSSEHQWAVTTVLNNNNIYLSDEFTFPRHNPKKQINLTSTTHNRTAMINAFMNDTQGIRIRSDNNSDIFENDYEKLTFIGSHVDYENLDINHINILSENNVIELSEQTVKSIGEMGKNFFLDRKEFEQNKITLEYRENYKNNILFTNYMIFTFENNILRHIEFNYNYPNNFVGNEREIVISNEALMTFLREVRLIHKYEEITIEKMDIVYKQQDYGTEYSTSLIALPFYRIYFEVNSEENLKTDVMLINAYTNMVE